MNENWEKQDLERLNGPKKVILVLMHSKQIGNMKIKTWGGGKQCTNHPASNVMGIFPQGTH